MDMEHLIRKMDSTNSGDSSDHDRAMNILSGLDRETGSDLDMDNDAYVMVIEHKEFTNDERGMRKIIGSKSKRK